MDINQIYQQFESDYTLLDKPVITKDFRSLATRYHKILKSHPLHDVLLFAETLLKDNKRGYTIVAYALVDKRHKDFTKETFTVFDHWVNTYIQDWWDCDDFMTHAMMRLYLQYPDVWEHILSWTTSDNFAVRRCAPVILVVPARKNLVDINRVFQVCDLLLDDEHYLVQKGFGWLLKEATKYYYNDVMDYLETNVHKMTRTAFRYAIEKLPKEEKDRLMSL